MSLWSRWKEDQAYRKAVRQLRRHKRQIDSATCEALTLQTRILRTTIPLRHRFSGASCEPISPDQVELLLMGRTAAVEVDQEQTIVATVDDQRYQVDQEWTFEPGKDPALKEARLVDGAGQVVARMAAGDRRAELFDGEGRPVFRHEGVFLFVGDELVGDFEGRYWMSGIAKLRLMRELDYLPVLLFAATLAVYVQTPAPPPA